MLRLIVLQRIRNNLDERRRTHHANLDCVGGDILKDRTELRREEIRRCLLHGQHARRILRRERRDDAHAVDAVGQHGLEVRLHPRAAAAVATRDREHLRHVRPYLFCHRPVSFAQCSPRSPCRRSASSV